MMGTDTTKDAALRLCAEVVEERDALLKLVRDYFESDTPMGGTTSKAQVHNTRYESARALLARLDGRTG